MLALDGRLAGDGDPAAIGAMPGRNAMTPPQLARDAPVADVLHPIEECLIPIVWNENDLAGVHRVQHLGGERLGFDEPLRGNERLHDGCASVTLAESQRVRLGFL